MSKEDFFLRKKKELGVSLNDVQKKAVLHTEGAILLLASPGSGKTTTIIMRTGYLIEEKGVNPARIKAVTFSKASANDMKERFATFFPTSPPVDFSTIHSLAFEVVRELFYKKGTAYQLIEGDGDGKKQNNFNGNYPPLHKKLLLRNLFHQVVGENITDDQLEEMTTYISFVKNKLLPREKWSQVDTNVPKAMEILFAYEKYKETGTNKLLLDYDDMLTIANEALENDSSLLKKYQDRYDYVLTDESQDTSMVQHAIIEKLVKRHGNICVVADDDQSIYGWRAAEPQYLLNFEAVYPDAKILMMEQNYRSSKDIVDVANKFIKRNKQRYDKNMFTENPPHQPIDVTKLPDYKYQAKYLVKQFDGMENYRRAAILYRNNSSSIILVNHFERAGIPFYMKDSDNRFFSHWVVEDVLNFMRLTFNDRRADILEKVHTKFNVFITKQQMVALKGIRNDKSVFDNLLHYVTLKDYQVTQLKKCKKTLQRMRGNSPLEVIRLIRHDLGYEKALETISKRLGFRLDYLIGILNTLEEIADPLETMEEFAQRLTYLEQVLKTSKFNKGKNAVTFSTFHSSKGLEFERVFMIDLIDGVIPAKEDLDEAKEGNKQKLEESVRLFYVAMTRAKQYLELITYKKKNNVSVKPSEFINNVQEILHPPQREKTRRLTRDETRLSTKIVNPNAINSVEELEEGRLIKHRVFGHGDIIGFDKTMIEIHFQRGTKKLAIDLCIEKGLLEYVD